MKKHLIEYNTENFSNKVRELTNDEYEVLGEYTGTNNKILMKHKLCGNEYLVTPSKFYQGRRCPVCRYKNKVTTKDYKEKIKKLTNDEYEVLGEYKDYHTKILMKHKLCGNEFYKTPSQIISSHQKCPYCNKNKFAKNFIDKLNSKFKDNEYKLIEDFVTTRTKIKVLHTKCGNEFISTPKQLLDDVCPCPFCRVNPLLKSEETFINEIKESFNGDEYELKSNYINDRTKVLLKHIKCGNEFYIRPNTFLNGTRCPICSNIDGKSIQEKLLFDYIKSIYNGNIIENDRDVLNGKELDIYLPDLKLAIEYDGLYWHNSKRKDKDYHLNKTIKCEEKGIQLIHIFSDEWNEKTNITKSKLAHIMGCNKNPKIYARNCYIKEIDSKIKNEFLDKNHIQGKDKASIKLGLYTNDNNILVAVMTFCKPRKSLGHNKDSEYDYELSRYANNINYRLIGGFGKLFSYFKKNYNFNKIITYADRRWSIGGVYKNNNFTLDHISNPNYWYIKNSTKNNRIHRYNFRKSKLKTLFPDIYSDDKTEFQIMEEANYNKIWDCGNLVYKYERK